jgi:hypothetical protein
MYIHIYIYTYIYKDIHIYIYIYIGTELFTAFTMSAPLWVDPDLPLQYAFGFIDAKGTLSYYDTKLSIKTHVLSVW